MSADASVFRALREEEGHFRLAPRSVGTRRAIQEYILRFVVVVKRGTTATRRGCSQPPQGPQMSKYPCSTMDDMRMDQVEIIAGDRVTDETDVIYVKRPGSWRATPRSIDSQRAARSGEFRRVQECAGRRANPEPGTRSPRAEESLTAARRVLRLRRARRASTSAERAHLDDDARAREEDRSRRESGEEGIRPALAASACAQTR